MQHSVLLLAIGFAAFFTESSTASGKDEFQTKVKPFVNKFCVDCHNADTSEGELDLTRYQTVESLGEFYRQWEHVITFLDNGEMPPKDANQPSAAERKQIIQSIKDLLKSEAEKLAGDPGVVLPRRLSNSEYNYTIRDITGVDIQPAKSFPVDPASGEGFDNTGEALRMSPSLFKKYYTAAEFVADHILFKPSGFEFAPFSVVTYADQKKFYEGEIIHFYQQHNVDYEVYLLEAWRFASHLDSEATKKPEEKSLIISSPQDWAKVKGLSSKYFIRLRDVLEGRKLDHTYIAWLRSEWRTLRAIQNEREAIRRIREIAQEIKRISQRICPVEAQPIRPGAGNPPIYHTHRRSVSAAERDKFNDAMLTDTAIIHTELRDLDKTDAVQVLLRAIESGGDIAEARSRSNVVSRSVVKLSKINFTTQNEKGYREDDGKRNRSLVSLLKEHAPDELKRLGLRIDPSNAQTDGRELTLELRKPITITIPTAALGKDKRVNLFARATLITQDSRKDEAAQDADNAKKSPISSVAEIKVQIASTQIDGTAKPDPVNEATSKNWPPAAGERTRSVSLFNRDHPSIGDIQKASELFCSLFPNRFLYVDDTRGLSAGFHLIEGFFRDDQPLCRWVLSDEQNEELDRLWEELYFGTDIVEKLLRGFVFFERSERNFMKHPDFDSIKEEDPELTKDTSIVRFRDIYLKRSNVKLDDPKLDEHPIYIFFQSIRDGLKKRVAQQDAARPIYERQILEFARRAYRRKLSDTEKKSIQQFFESVVDDPEYGIEQAVRASIVRILVSPKFCYRMFAQPDGETTRPLTSDQLASRLSYFVWSSTPDDELLQLASRGEISSEQLLRQTRRMLDNPRVQDFAREFFGQWLGYRDFLTQESVNRDVFKEFDDELKQAMFDEPTWFIRHLIQTDASVIQLIDCDSTFVNARLAKHYGIPFTPKPLGDEAKLGLIGNQISPHDVARLLAKGHRPSTDDDGRSEQWQRVEGLKQKGRSGLLGMAVLLTKNSQPERTSPVKRGFWVFHKLLGQHIPAPPADVAVLPAKETDTNGKTIRELLKLHTVDEKCARCHVRFDPMGLAMEGFDPIGRSRAKDMAGRKIDNVVALSGGAKAEGVPEFAEHLATARRDDFVRTLCRKFLGYALGRSLVLSDQPLLTKMENRLKRDEYRFSGLFETVVLSPQFRTQRCRDFSTTKFRQTKLSLGR